MIKTYKGYTITIDTMDQDEILNPRETSRNYGTMALFHKKLNLGDKDPRDQVEDGDPVTLTRAQVIEADKKGFISLPVYGYDHGCMRLSTTPFGDKFDSVKLGCIFVATKDRSPALRDEDYQEILREEVEVYDQYLNGEVFFYQVEGTSCYGNQYYKEDSAIEDAMERVDELIESGATPVAALGPLDTAKCLETFHGLVEAGVLPEPTLDMDETMVKALGGSDLCVATGTPEELEEPAPEDAVEDGPRSEDLHTNSLEINGCFIA